MKITHYKSPITAHGFPLPGCRSRPAILRPLTASHLPHILVRSCQAIDLEKRLDEIHRCQDLLLTQVLGSFRIDLLLQPLN